MSSRYEVKPAGSKVSVFDTEKNLSLGLLHSAQVAGQVVEELNKMERKRA